VSTTPAPATGDPSCSLVPIRAPPPPPLHGDNPHPPPLSPVDVTPDFKAKPNAHSICAQESSFHAYRTEMDTE
jgi:hypothetical protein